MRWWDWLNFRGEEQRRQGQLQRRAVIALGGGGARGLAHLGAMQAIGESGIRTERIVGVSMGSLIGGMCAVEPDILKVQAKAIEFLRSPTFQSKQRALFGEAASEIPEDSPGIFAWYNRMMRFVSAHRQFNRAVTLPSLMPSVAIQDAIERLLPDIDLQDLSLPLSVVCVDLLSGHRVVLETGSLRNAVRASMAIPGVYPPVRWDAMLLCDIGVFDSLPNKIAQSYASDLTIGVDVGQERSAIAQCGTALDVMMRMQDIGEQLLRRHVHSAADLVIQPKVGHVSWFDFSDPESLVQAGLSAGHHALLRLNNRATPMAMIDPSMRFNGEATGAATQASLKTA